MYLRHNRLVAMIVGVTAEIPVLLLTYIAGMLLAAYCYTMTVMLELGGERVLLCEPDGPLFDGEQRVTDLVGDALSMRATMIAVPVSRLDLSFFDLRSGLAGALAQKVVTYRFKLAIVGDITDRLAASSALRDWVREGNRGGAVLFVPSLDDLVARLGNATSAP